MESEEDDGSSPIRRRRQSSGSSLTIPTTTSFDTSPNVTQGASRCVTFKEEEEGHNEDDAIQVNLLEVSNGAFFIVSLNFSVYSKQAVFVTIKTDLDFLLTV